MLAESASLLAFISKELRYSEPSNRLLEIRGLGRDHASERRRHLRPQRNGAPAFIFEVVELFYYLLAALRRVQLERFQRRPVVLLESISG